MSGEKELVRVALDAFHYPDRAGIVFASVVAALMVWSSWSSAQLAPGGLKVACYTAVQHDVYSQDGDRTLSISYSNGEEYQVYLHKIRLAVAVIEWIDDRGRAIYVAGNT